MEKYGMFRPAAWSWRTRTKRGHISLHSAEGQTVIWIALPNGLDLPARFGGGVPDFESKRERGTAAGLPADSVPNKNGQPAWLANVMNVPAPAPSRTNPTKMKASICDMAQGLRMATSSCC
jgi:hypothetical protein